MRALSGRFLLLFLAAGLFAAVGCRRPNRAAGAATPEACVQAFDAAMRGGDTGRAASLFAYSQIAADNNSDWSSFTPAQRDLIAGKMREQQVQQLAGWCGAYIHGTYQVTGLAQQGQWATLNLVGGGQSIPVKLFSPNGRWLLYSIGNLPAPTPGS